MKKVEADAALSKAVNIVARSVGTTSKLYQKRTIRAALFCKVAGPVSTVLCPAESTICTITEGKVPPRQGSIQERQCVHSPQFHQQHLLSAKRKRQMEADPQFQSSKSLHQTPALQN